MHLRPPTAPTETVSNNPARHPAPLGSPVSDKSPTIMPTTNPPIRTSPSGEGVQPLAATATSASKDRRIDQILSARFKAGDESAFTEIMQRHQGKIHRLVLTLVNDLGDAEEITQDTFIRAYHALARFRGDSSLATWLHHIAVNLARNRYWYFFRRKRHVSCSLERLLAGDGEFTVAGLIASDDHDPAQATIWSEFLDPAPNPI